MMPTTWIAALLALVPGVALGANLRTNNEVVQHATSAALPTRQHASRRLQRPRRSHRSRRSRISDDSYGSGEGGVLEASYVGCFRDNQESSVMDFGFRSAGCTIELCMMHCTESGASFMGLKHGFECWCGFGEEYEYTLNGAGTCTDKCNGGGSLSCGGLNAFALYSVGEENISTSEPPGSPSPTASPVAHAAPIPPEPTTPSVTPETTSPVTPETPCPVTAELEPTTAPTPPPVTVEPVTPETPSPVTAEPEPTTAPTPPPVTVELVRTSSPVAPVVPLTPAPVAPVLPPTQPSPAGSSIAADMVELLDLHNEARCIHNASPLTWSNAVASSAAEHADRLTGDCGQLYHSESRQRHGYGENIYTCMGTDTCYSPARAMHKLYYEEVKFVSEVTDYGGHATQILWKSTEEIGCAVATCTTGGDPHTYLVCQYDPPGNVSGQYEEEVGLLTTPGSC